MVRTIKNETSHKLAAELARRLDVSMTAAVTIALRDKLAATEDRAMAERRLGRLLKTANAIAARLTPEQRSIRLEDELYDAEGLPRSSSTVRR